MSQQAVFANPNHPYRRKLFVHNGVEFTVVGGRIIEPYSPPTPELRTNELKILNSASEFHNMGTSHYACSLSLLFKDRASYQEYLSYINNLHKFYDERGNIYIGGAENLKTSAREAMQKYIVEISFVFVKKDWYEIDRDIKFQDISAQSTEVQQDIRELAMIGLLASRSWDLELVDFFRPNEGLTRAEAISVVNRLRRYLVDYLRG